MKCWLSQHENTMLSVKNEARLATEQDQRGGSKGDLRRQEKVGESSFSKWENVLSGKADRDSLLIVLASLCPFLFLTYARSFPLR